MNSRKNLGSVDLSKKSFSEIIELVKEKYEPEKFDESLPCIELANLKTVKPGLLGNVDFSSSKSSKYYFEQGDILFGKLRPYLRKYLYCPFNGICSTEIWVFRNKEGVLGKYIFYLIQGERFTSYANVTTGTRMPRTDWDFLSSVKFVILPLPEQERIVAVLETWDEYLEKIDQKIEVKKKIKRGLMQQLLSGERRLPGFSDKWKTKSLSEIGFFRKGKGGLKNQLSESGSRIIRYGDIYTKYNILVDKTNAYISKHEVGETEPIKKNEVIFAGSGETIDEIGKSVVYVGDENCYAGGDTIIFTPKEQNSLFLVYTLNSGETWNSLRRKGQGQSIVHIHTANIKKIWLKLPPLEEQQAIATVLSTADEEIETLGNKRETILNQKKYLLNHLITGKIRTPEDLI